MKVYSLENDLWVYVRAECMQYMNNTTHIRAFSSLALIYRSGEARLNISTTEAHTQNTKPAAVAYLSALKYLFSFISPHSRKAHFTDEKLFY